MRRLHPSIWPSAAVVIAAGALFSVRAKGLAIADENALTYAGTLETPDGQLVTGPRNIELRLWDSGEEGQTLCTNGGESVNLLNGRFALALPASCAQSMAEATEVWSEVLVDGAPLGRTRVTAVPYALQAGSAQVASSASFADKATAATTAERATAAQTAELAQRANAAGGELQKTLDTIDSEIKTLQAGDLRVFYKSGNNGTKDCDSYCAGWTDRGNGTCVAAYRPDTNLYIPCAEQPANFAGGTLHCWCARPATP